MSRKMVLKNTRSRSHFWLKNLRVQPLFVFWDPGSFPSFVAYQTKKFTL